MISEKIMYTSFIVCVFTIVLIRLIGVFEPPFWVELVLSIVTVLSIISLLASALYSVWML